MNKKQLMKHLHEEVFCRVAPSKIHGVGLFAVKHIPKGTDPFLNSLEDKSVKLSLADMDTLEPGVRKIVHDMSGFEDNTYHVHAYGFNIIHPLFFINHSKDFNIVTEGLRYIAARDIEVGEELTVDYETFNDIVEH
jgi:SET domain-containing protein